MNFSWLSIHISQSPMLHLQSTLAADPEAKPYEL